MKATGERLGGTGQCLVPGRARQDETAGPAVAVQLGLDRVEYQRDVLVLVDADRSSTCDECPGVSGHRVADGYVVEVDNLGLDAGGEAPEQVDLPTDRGHWRRTTGSSAILAATIGASRRGTRPLNRYEFGGR